MMNFADLKFLLDSKVEELNRPGFIVQDPISIPHRFSISQDIEIAGFFASILAWGQRKTIINKCTDLLDRMDNSPYSFIKQHSDLDLRRLTGFVHRTFNDTDLLYFIAFLREHYRLFDSLEDAFLIGHHNSGSEAFTIESVLNNFRGYFMSLPDFPSRTGKHISSPVQQSACKRLNMFLRWMVRKDDKGVDFGIWKRLSPEMLICPYDVHVDRVGRALGLVTRKQRDWKTAMELTENLRKFDSKDPVKYDFALFGMGVLGLL